MLRNPFYQSLQYNYILFEPAVSFEKARHMKYLSIICMEFLVYMRKYTVPRYSNFLESLNEVEKC